MPISVHGYILLDSFRDHRVNDFGDFENKEWIKKQDHLRFVQEYAANKGRPLRIVPVYTGLFLELSLGVCSYTAIIWVLGTDYCHAAVVYVHSI